MPAHAYAFDTSYGRGWECGRGYQEHNETCTAVAVPQNAYLNASGDSWECNRSYLQVGEACAEPVTAAEVVPLLFKRELDAHQIMFAMGESLAHLAHLAARGQLRRECGADGIDRYRRG